MSEAGSNKPHLLRQKKVAEASLQAYKRLLQIEDDLFFIKIHRKQFTFELN